ncbi:MAG: DUF4760 domain-containing protein [Bacteroidota bacterium]
MNAKSHESNTLKVFLAITVLSFVAWILGLSMLGLLLNRLGVDFDLFAMIESLSIALAAAAALGAGFIAYRELSEVSTSRHMDIADRLFDELNSDENIEARRRVYQGLQADTEDGIQNMTPDQQEAIKRVLNSLDRVAFLTQSGWIPDDTIMPWMHPMIAKSWEKLEPYVLYERARRNEPYYYRYAGELAVRCQGWRARNLEEVRIKWVDKAL